MPQTKKATVKKVNAKQIVLMTRQEDERKQALDDAAAGRRHFSQKLTHFSSGLSSHFNFNERIMTSTTKSKPPHSTSALKFASVSCRFLNGLPTMYEIFHRLL